VVDMLLGCYKDKLIPR